MLTSSINHSLEFLPRTLLGKSKHLKQSAESKQKLDILISAVGQNAGNRDHCLPVSSKNLSRMLDIFYHQWREDFKMDPWISETFIVLFWKLMHI